MIAVRNKGFSLIEILLVIGIIAVLAIAAFLVFPQVQASQRAQVERENIVAIATGIKQVFLMKGYVGLDNDVANNARAFPLKMNGGNYGVGQEITSSWGGEVEVAPGASTQNFTIRYSDVPSRVCEPLLRSISGIFERVTVDATVVKNHLDGARVDYDPGQGVQVCAGDNEAVIIVETH